MNEESGCRRSDPALSVRNLTVSFGSLRAVDDVSLSIGVGEVIGLVGTNGAGKSTLVNAVAGVCPIARGAIWLGPVDVTRTASWRRARLGLGRTFQNLEVFESMTVLENVLSCRDWMTSWNVRRKGEARRMALEALEEIGLDRLAGRTVGQLSYPDRKLVEFARALVAEAKLLLLDEPTAGVALEERAAVVEVLRGVLRRRPNLAVIVIEHDISVIEALCGAVHVMGSGQIMFSGSFGEMMNDQGVREAYLGTGVERERD